MVRPSVLFFLSLTIQRAINTLGIVTGSNIAATITTRIINMGTNINWIHDNSDLDISPVTAIDESQAQAKIKIKPKKHFPESAMASRVIRLTGKLSSQQL